MTVVAIIIGLIIIGGFVLIAIRMILNHKGDIDAEANFKKGQLHIKKSK